MTTTSERLRSYWGERQISADRFALLAARYWEIALFGVLISLALGLRLWDLGARAVHHDESLHMFYAWQLFRGDGYLHVPFMHGPLQFYGSALIFRLFGDSDYTARLLYALVGSAMVGVPYFLRNYIGRAGALIAALLLAISPSLLYFSRFARGDIYMVAFTLGLVIIMWRYLKERRENYLYFVAPLLVLSFLTVEFTFIAVAIFLVYLEVELARNLVDQIRASRPLSTVEHVVVFAILLVLGWVIVALWPLIERTRRNWSLNDMPAAGDLIVLIGTISIPLFGPGIEKVPLLNLGDKQFYQDVQGGENVLFWGTTIVLMFGAAWIGIIWKPRVWLVSAAAFYIPFVLLFTTGFSNMAGFKSGMWGSLDYWLGQQYERRGNQPDYYYFLTTPVYEFLPLIFALGGSLYYAFRARTEQVLLAGASLLLVIMLILLPDFRFHLQVSFVIVIATVLLLSMDSFTKFLLFWTLSILFALTAAGEKMPWLTIHLALPLVLLAAKIMDDILSGVPEAFAKVRDGATSDTTGEPRPVSFQNMLPLVSGGGAAIIAAAFFQAVGPASAISIVPWLLSLVAAAVVLRTASRISLRAAGQVAAVALFAAMLPFTIRAAGHAAYDQGDPDGYPREMLIYAQGSPKLDVINDEITRIAETSGLGKDLRIVIDNSVNIWPWPWYMRNRSYEANNFDGEFTPAPGQVVLISQAHQQKMQPYLDQYYEGIPYSHMWWFPEFYRGLDAGDFIGDVLMGRYLSTWRGYFIDRAVPGASESPDHIAYFPKSFDAPIVAPAGADSLPADSVTALGGPGGQTGQFTQPGDLALDAAGNLFIVDTLNHRIQRMTADGEFTTFGEAGNGESQFANPRTDTYAVDDGPWGIAVDDDGNIYVADTWNGRIQKFDSDFNFLLEWGAGEFFGPRDVAIDSDGNVLIIDTGNNRIAKYTTAGEFIQAYGKAGNEEGRFASGSGPGEFHEPTSVVIASNGDIYVADFWNQRIQIFDSQLRYRDEINVESWPGANRTAITDRAYIAVLDDGRVLATDPSSARIIVFSASGDEQAAWKLPSDVGVTRPVGIAVDGDQVYVSDSLANRVVRLPLAALLAVPPSQ